MKTLSAKLDKIASTLEASGRQELAMSLDAVANTMDKQAFLSGILTGLKNLLGKNALPPEKALQVLRSHGVHHIDQTMLNDALGTESAGAEKSAGLLGDGLRSLLQNPVKVALISLALAAGSANAADINKMVSLMPMPSSTQVTLLETGAAPLWMFKSQFKSMVEDNLDKDTPLGKYVQERIKAGESKDGLVKDLMVAFQKKLEDPTHRDTLKKLNKYLQSKDVNDSATHFLEPLVQQVAMSELC